MRLFARLVQMVLIAAMAVGGAAGLAAAQGTPEPLSDVLAGCGGGRPPSTPEADDLMDEDRNEYYAWEGVCRPEPIGERVEPANLPELIGSELPEALQADLDAALETNPNLVFQPYGVGFQKEFATVPRIAQDEGDEVGPELMVVVVRQGTFVLNLYTAEPAIYVSTSNPDGIPTMTPWDMDLDKPHYTETGDVLMADGDPCLQACLVEPETPVMLRPGDIAFAQAGAICTYCLAQSIIDENDIPILQAYALLEPAADPEDLSWLESFSWVQSWTRANLEPSQRGMPSQETTMLGWALPNLATGCKDG